MQTKLTNFNRHLARAVMVASALFAVGVTVLAGLTGTTSLLAGSALALAAGGYAYVVARKPSGELVELRHTRRTVAA